MACSFRRFYYKYTKCLVITVLIAFFVQILLALNYFPIENDNLLKTKSYENTEKQEVAGVSARKADVRYIDDEDFTVKNNHKSATHLRVEELDFKPSCEIQNREAISAIHRAKTQNCKQEIVNLTCLIQGGSFYPKRLPNACTGNNVVYGKHLGCFKDEKKLRILSSFYGNYATTNSQTSCLDICVQAGFPYAGVQYAYVSVV